MAEPEFVIDHPNRDKAASKATRAVVIFLLVASAALVLLVTIAGWSVLDGAQAIQLAYVVIYLVMAYYVGRWNRGVLPMAAALAILLAIFAAVAVPHWFDRDAAGFAQPALDAAVLGLITAIIIPVQILLIVFAMRGFNQAWNVEIERRVDGPGHAAPGTA